ncbi:sugar ABC transporter substrate-binding protein [Kibdelosporangium phytohabitans]|nr:substrate-binding domain-containing protein [Kibdelosporangium phytohabitans]MBE1461945.1 ribose transport system substrate-binding protein [Kibdelosporangium phytohabitans]
MTKRLRGIAVALTSLSTVSLLVACGEGGSGSPNADGTCGSAGKKLDLAFVYASTTQNPFQEMALGAQAAADDDGNVNLQLSAPTGIDGPKQVSMFQAAARTSKDGIAYQTVTPDLFVRPLNTATDGGVPVVAVDAGPPPGSKVKTFVANSNTKLGELLGEAFVAKNPNPNGKVLLGNDIPSLQLLVQRLNGVQNVLKAKLPNMTVIGPVDTKSEPTENTVAWRGFVQANPDVDAFIGVGSQDGVALPLIASQTGRKYIAGSADLPPEAMQAVKDGSVLFALSSPEHWMKGYIATHLLIESKRKCKPMPEGWWNSGNLLVEKSNVDQIIARQQSPESRKAWFRKEIDKQLASPPISALDKAD